MVSFYRSLFKFYKRDLDNLFDKKIESRKSGPFFFIKSKKENLKGRLMLVISRKVGIACKRNLLRRRLRSIFYTEQLYDKEYDLGVICYKGATLKSFLQLKQELLKQTTT